MYMIYGTASSPLRETVDSLGGTKHKQQILADSGKLPQTQRCGADDDSDNLSMNISWDSLPTSSAGNSPAKASTHVDSPSTPNIFYGFESEISSDPSSSGNLQSHVANAGSHANREGRSVLVSVLEVAVATTPAPPSHAPDFAAGVSDDISWDSSST